MNKTAFKMPETRLDDKGRVLVSARELHAAVGSKLNFSRWIKDRILELDLIEHHHFEPSLSISGRGEYDLSLDAARQMAFLEEGEVLAEICKYFILNENRKVTLVEPMRQSRHIRGIAFA